MPLTPPTDLSTLAGQRDRLADVAGYPGGHGAIRDAGVQQRIDNAIGEGLDMLAVDLGLEVKTLENEDGFNTAATLSGTDMVLTQDSPVVTSAASTFQASGVAVGDKINVGDLEGTLRVLTIDSETQLTLELAITSANAIDQSFTLVRDEFALADDAWWVDRVWDATNARPLRIVSQEQLSNDTGENFETLLASASEPFLAMIVHPRTPTGVSVGTMLRLYPAPDSRFNIKYTYKRLPTFAPTLVTRNHLGQVLFFASATAYFRDDDDRERAADYIASYRSWLPRIAKIDRNRARVRVVMRQGPIGPARRGLPFMSRDQRIIPGD